MESIENSPVCLITGANAGIGKATAMGLAAKGFQLCLSGRNRVQLEQVCQEIKTQFPNSKPVFLVADLAEPSEVHRLAKEILATQTRLDVLINNAGCFYSDYRENSRGCEFQFAVNHLAPFLLTGLLMPLLSKTPGSRIVNVASGAHRMGKLNWEDLNLKSDYKPLLAYAQSKLCNILFTNRLAKKSPQTGVHAFSLHPGAVNTQIGEKNGNTLSNLVWRWMRPFFLSVEKGAATSVYLASQPLDRLTNGGYYIKCKLAKPTPAAQSLQDADRLWEVSQSLVQFSY